MVRGALVDFGGTIDTDGIHWMQMFGMAYQSCGLPTDGLRDAYVYAERYLGGNAVIRPDFTFRETLRRKILLQLDFLRLNADAGMLLDYCYNYVSDNIGNVAFPVLQELSGRMPLALVSNFYGNMHTVLCEFDIGRFFSAVVESAVAGIRKPDPEIFRLGARAIGLEPDETVAIGDSPDKDIIPAAAAGCSTVWLSGSGWSDTAVCKADCTISSLRELPEIPLISGNPQSNL